MVKKLKPFRPITKDDIIPSYPPQETPSSQAPSFYNTNILFNANNFTNTQLEAGLIVWNGPCILKFIYFQKDMSGCEFSLYDNNTPSLTYANETSLIILNVAILKGNWLQVDCIVNTALKIHQLDLTGGGARASNLLFVFAPKLK